jgi:hypothetical protein
MILCYALGGGLGHVARSRALLHTLGEAGGGRGAGLDGEPVTVLVSSPLALDSRALGSWTAMPAPDGAAASATALGAWVEEAVARLKPRAVYVDAFAGGVLGELCGMAWPPGVELCHTARRLRWQRYRRRLGGGPLPVYRRTHVVEPLEEEHRATLAACSAELAEVAVVDPPERPMPRSETPNGAGLAPAGDGAPAAVGLALAGVTWDGVAAAGAAGAGAATVGAESGVAPGDAWLVVHSGPPAEILQLVAYAADLRRQAGSSAPLALIAPLGPPDLPAGTVHLDLYPAWPLFAAASRIVTACGWNSMRQTEAHRQRHHFLPFPRPLDDQFERAARRRRAEPASP